MTWTGQNHRSKPAPWKPASAERRFSWSSSATTSGSGWLSRSVRDASRRILLGEPGAEFLWGLQHVRRDAWADPHPAPTRLGTGRPM